MINQPSLTRYDVSLSNSPRDFPSRNDPFVDRENELAQVLRFLNPIAGPRGIFIYGQGGVGKTTLAIEAAHRSWQRKDYDELVYLTAKAQYWDVENSDEYGVDRRGSKLHFATYGGMLVRLIYLLAGRYPHEARDKDNNQRIDMIKELLENRNVLILIDNLDTMNSEDDKKMISGFVNFGLPDTCKALITSRAYIREITREGFVEVELSAFDDTYSYTLLVELLKEHNITITSRNADRIVDLLVDAGGTPLIIKQVASMIAKLGVEKTISGLENPRERILSYIFDTSIAQVNLNSRSILYVASLAMSPVNDRYLTTILRLTPQNVLECTEELEKWSLISRSGRNYEVHYILKQYIAQILRRNTKFWEDINRRIQTYEDTL